MPTLLIAGQSSHVIGEDNIRDAAETRGARIVWIDAGHFVSFEQPDAFVAAVRDFLHEVGISR